MIALFSPYYVRVGPLGSLGRFVSVDPVRFRRGTRVICRTTRGLEIGEITAWIDAEPPTCPDGTILRGMTPEDEFLWQRLNDRRDHAFQECQDMLKSFGISAVLIDAEILFDASSIYFYFLGEPPQTDSTLLASLAAQYESEIRFAEFAAAVEHGCGPGCGTESAQGCGDACSTCSVAQACRTKSRDETDLHP